MSISKRMPILEADDVILDKCLRDAFRVSALSHDDRCECAGLPNATAGCWCGGTVARKYHLLSS
jgi:hypothetical protein